MRRRGAQSGCRGARDRPRQPESSSGKSGRREGAIGPRPLRVGIGAPILSPLPGCSARGPTIGAIIRRWRLHRHHLGRTVAMVATVLGLFLVHTIEIWPWALIYVAISAIAGIAEAFYFSTATFSTIGYGDIVLSTEWRLLSGRTLLRPRRGTAGAAPAERSPPMASACASPPFGLVQELCHRHGLDPGALIVLPFLD